MMPDDQGTRPFAQLTGALEGAALSVFALFALAMTGVSAAGSAGLLPMLSLPATLDARPFDAGPPLQWGASVLLLAVLALGPGMLRIRRLEGQHRSFRVGMEDVTRAYWAAHAADRAGVFTLHREFDAVRERFEFLKRHPKFGEIDPEILELAAQMSTEARELARIYSDEAVARAETSLAERRMEAERLSRLIDTAHGVTREMRRALADTEIEEDMLRSRIEGLRAELSGLWAEIDAGGPRSPDQRIRVAAE